MQIFLTIVILLVMLGILISAHEAGHLIMAKSFNVYCLEYSIGFGPKLFSKKRKGGETRFSLRAFPLGGYVSMFGEGVDLPDGVEVPPERSLNGVAPWKRAIILSAGIVVNFFLSIVFVVIYSTCIKTYYVTQLVYTGLDENGVSLSDTSAHGEIAYSFWIRGTIGTYQISENEDRLYSPLGFDYDSTEYFVVDPQAKITNASGSQDVVACFTPTSVNDADFLNNLTFFYPKEAYAPTALRSVMGLTAYPDMSKGSYSLVDGDVLSINPVVIKTDAEEDRPLRTQFANRVAYPYSGTASIVDNNVKFASNTLTVYSYQSYAPFGQAMRNACYYYSRYFSGIGEGFKAIFSFDFSDLGSVVAMGGVLSAESTQIGWGRTFFFYGGYLSLNLAIFNLLPIPGLDGWQLFVTIVEASVNSAKKKKWERKRKTSLAKATSEKDASTTLSESESYQPWKINDKLKNTVSAIGLALLFLFAIAITIKDIVSLVK